MAPRQELSERGIYVARSVLPLAEVATLRCALNAHFKLGGQPEGLGQHQAGAAAAIPALAPLILNNRILQTLRGLTGSDQLVFTGNCDAHFNVLSQWHRDLGAPWGAPEDNATSRDDFRVIRVGIYLQDHIKDDRGLRACIGSHRIAAANILYAEQFHPRAGDITFHDLRLMHAGAMPDLVERNLQRISRRLQNPGQLLGARRVWLRLAGRADKLAVFFTMGIADRATETYCRADLDLRRSILGQDGFMLPSALVKALNASNVLTYESELGAQALERFRRTGRLPDRRLWA